MMSNQIPMMIGYKAIDPKVSGFSRSSGIGIYTFVFMVPAYHLDTRSAYGYPPKIILEAHYAKKIQKSVG